MATLEQRAAEQLNVDIVPGTEVMTNLGEAHYATAGGVNGSVYVCASHGSNSY